MPHPLGGVSRGNKMPLGFVYSFQSYIQRVHGIIVCKTVGAVA